MPFTVIATKADKLSKAAAARGVENIACAFKCGRDDILLTSSQTRQGLEGVLNRLEQILIKQ